MDVHYCSPISVKLQPIYYSRNLSFANEIQSGTCTKINHAQMSSFPTMWLIAHSIWPAVYAFIYVCYSYRYK